MKKLNQNKKKIFAAVLSLVLAMSLVACGGKKEETASNNASTEATMQAEEQKQESVAAATTEEEPVEEEIVEETPAMLPIPEDTVLLRDGTSYILYPTKFIYCFEDAPLYVQTDFDYNPDTRTITCIQTNLPVEDAPAGTLDYTNNVPAMAGTSIEYEGVYVFLNMMAFPPMYKIADATVFGSITGGEGGDIIYDFYPANEADYEAFKASNPGQRPYEGLMYGTITATYTFPEQEMKPFDLFSEYNRDYYSLPDLGYSVVYGTLFGATEYPVDDTNTSWLESGIEYVPPTE